MERGVGQKPEKSSKVADGESDIAVAARYGLLLFIALAGSFVFYVSLIMSVQAIAIEAGHRGSSLRGIMGWTMGVMLMLSVLPLVHFSVAELPAMARTYAKENLAKGFVFVVLALVGGFLMLA